jgi:uncharacterized membrane protein YedE/YeeE
MKPLVTAFVSGALVALGLGVAGMTQPAKVVAFLDVTGDWDPSLAFVMLGAIGVYALGYRVARRRGVPVFAAAFALPTRRDIDARLVGGAALFGLGWGLVGYCPGPALTALASGQVGSFVFVAAMLAGMVLAQRAAPDRPALRAMSREPVAADV